MPASEEGDEPGYSYRCTSCPEAYNVCANCWSGSLTPIYISDEAPANADSEVEIRTIAKSTARLRQEMLTDAELQVELQARLGVKVAEIREAEGEDALVDLLLETVEARLGELRDTLGDAREHMGAVKTPFLSNLYINIVPRQARETLRDKAVFCAGEETLRELVRTTARFVHFS